MSILRKDPTRTTTLQRKFISDLKRRFAQVKRDTTEIIVKLDVFGLSNKKITGFEEMDIVGNVDPLPLRQAWRFQTDSKKLQSFRDWLQAEVDAEILSTTNGGNPWVSKYIGSAYRTGVIRSYNEVNTATGGGSVDFYAGRREQFLDSAFNQPERLSKMEFLYTRTYEQLRGISAAMSQQMQQVLSSGIASGKGPYEIARQLSGTISGITRQRANTLARTEIVSAHAEGQLDSFEELGIEGVSVLAEWSTAEDDLVCPLCEPLEGAVMTIDEARGLIPRHPNCRCAWIPANVGERTPTQMRKQRGKLKTQVDKSLKAEIPKRSRKHIDGTTTIELEPVPQSMFEARSRSPWLGSERTFPGATRYRLTSTALRKAIAKSERVRGVVPTPRIPKVTSKVDDIAPPVQKISPDEIIRENMAKDIIEVEDIVRDAEYEYATVWDPKTGKRVIDGKTSDLVNGVDFTERELGKMNGNILSHNHPRSTSFSPDDIQFASHFNLSEIRVASQKYDYVLSPKQFGGWPPPRGIKASARTLTDEVGEELKQSIYAGEITVEFAMQNVQHFVNLRLAERYQFNYERIIR